MADAVELRGLKELEENLQRLGTVAGARVMRQALFAATKPILDQAKANIRAWPRGSGALELSMGRTFRTFGVDRGVDVNAGGRFVVSIGPRTKANTAKALYSLYYGRRIGGIFYGHLLEFGHRIVRRHGSGRLNRRGREKMIRSTLGSVPPQRFLRPALDTAGLRATFQFQIQLKKRIERALKKQDPGTDNA